MIRSHDIRCIPDECLGLAVCDTIRRNHERLVEVRANRAASFFAEARAARDDVAAGAYPSLGRESLTAPMFRDGVEVARAVVNIIGVWARGTYIVRDIRNGNEWIAFTSEIHTL